MDLKTLKEIEESCIESNNYLIQNLAKDLQITPDELIQKIKLVGQHDVLLNMSNQVNQVYQQNPNAIVNFGDYGDNVARQINVDPEEMFKSVLVSGYNELLLNVVKQLNGIYNKMRELEQNK